MASLGTCVHAYNYTGGCIKHETNGTLQACSILRLHYNINSATGALFIITYIPLHPCILGNRGGL